MSVEDFLGSFTYMADMDYFKKEAPKKSNNPNEPLNSNQQISEIRLRLTEFMQETTENFAVLNNRLNKIQAEMDKLSTEPSEIKGSVDVDSFKKMEAKVAEMSEEINQVNNLVNGTIKNYIMEIYLFMQEQKEKQKAEQNNLESISRVSSK